MDYASVVIDLSTIIDTISVHTTKLYYNSNWGHISLTTSESLVRAGSIIGSGIGNYQGRDHVNDDQRAEKIDEVQKIVLANLFPNYLGIRWVVANNIANGFGALDSDRDDQNLL
ncbi:hypothetical protein J6590_018123 [Homalodisca vitripennis]|nr:hypothetical protein J6590_018123 [Homalodisca vitripennis]